MVFWSLFAGLLSGICWLLGDIFLVGFELEKEKYRDFVADSQLVNKNMTILMLAGSIKRLRFGALIANFSIPLMLASLYGIFQLANATVWAGVAVVLLGIGFSLSPVAHVAFYYVGRASQAAYERTGGKTCQDTDAKLINDFTAFLNLTWRAAVFTTALGWLVYTVLILSGQTLLPAYLGFFSPIFGVFLALFLVEKLRLGRPYLNGAGLNIALSLFFLVTLLYLLLA